MSEETQNRTRLGRILAGVGAAWIALFVIANLFDVGGTPLGDILSFFGDNLFLPLILIFTGRSMTRRGKRGSVEEALRSLGTTPPQRTETPTTETKTPPIIPGQAPPPQPVSRRTPPPSRRPTPAPVPKQPTVEELAASIGFEEPKEVAPEPSEVKPAGRKPKTSEEMVAEARKKFNKDA